MAVFSDAGVCNAARKDAGNALAIATFIIFPVENPRTNKNTLRRTIPPGGYSVLFDVVPLDVVT
jgi:hypothetical protein